MGCRALWAKRNALILIAPTGWLQAVLASQFEQLSRVSIAIAGVCKGSLHTYDQQERGMPINPIELYSW
jgi:hypothetical protein